MNTPLILRYLAYFLFLLTGFFTSVEFAQAKTPTPRRTVRVIYLVSQDREEKPAYTTAISAAITELRKWYAGQLKGVTFELHQPVVEVVKSKQKASWFYTHENGDNRDDWGYNNALAEAARLVRARRNDPQFIWVIYSDGPGDKGRGGSGVAVLPENDLLGLVGRHPTQPSKKRWVAGLGHELGHAFGLPHPADTQNHAHALMWTGIYGSYPDKAYLTQQDKATLLKSPFFYHPDSSPVRKAE